MLPLWHALGGTAGRLAQVRPAVRLLLVVVRAVACLEPTLLRFLRLSPLARQGGLSGFACADAMSSSLGRVRCTIPCLPSTWSPAPPCRPHGHLDLVMSFYGLGFQESSWANALRAYADTVQWPSFPATGGLQKGEA